MDHSQNISVSVSMPNLSQNLKRIHQRQVIQTKSTAVNKDKYKTNSTHETKLVTNNRF